MDTNTLMTMLLQEAEHQNLRAQQCKQIGKGKGDKKSEALVLDADKPKEKRDMSKITCWNCGETGHFSSKCGKPKKSKDTGKLYQSNSKREGTSASVNTVESSSDDEALSLGSGRSRCWVYRLV